ncbi:hypothetical protein SSX86_000167 [Deinandra increscens subsp. villosa]|uniref:C2H2-type domain-containing protein n=1 Tax=Deinandra increscens subsp. villosa TaxID=3103831 RepID=A0AAP0E083_9ASTR
MFEEQSIIPNLTSFPTPNPNPNSIPPRTDASESPASQGFNRLQDRSALPTVGAADFPSGTISQATASTADQHVGVTMSETTNNVLATTMPPESVLLFQCEVCNISCNSKEVLEAHKQGKKHLKSLKKVADAPANAPIIMPPTVASETLVEESENKMLRALKNGATPETLLYCDICKVICNNQEGFQKHVASKKHSAKSIIQLASTNAVFDGTSDSIGGSQKKPDPFQCGLCKITCTGNEHLQMHIAGKKHLKKLQELGLTPDLPLTPIASQDTPPTKPMVNPESNEGKPVNLQEAKPVCELCGISCDTNEMLEIHKAGKKHLKKLKESGQVPNLPVTSIASEDTSPTKPVVNPESNEGKTVNLHDAKPVCELCGISCDTNEMLKVHITGRKHRKNVEKSEKLIGPNPALTTEPAKVIGPLQEEGMIVNSDGSKRKKRGRIDEDVEAKKQKIVQSGTASDAVQTCELCNVVCNSPKVFNAHLGGQKHAAMALKQAEIQGGATGQES